MAIDYAARALPVLAGAALALALAACSQTTYGTGTSAGLQTITDIAKAASLGDKKDPIDFTPRPPVVAPPTTASLPPPGSGPTTTSVAADWPKDPEVQAATVKAQIAQAQASGRPITIKQPPKSPPSQEVTGSIDINSPDNFKTTPAQEAEVKRLLALSNSGSADANGNPVRQYLTDPPAGYLAGDPNAPPPTTPEKKPTRAIKWPWQWFSRN
jgi:hypothetical protein